MIKEINNFFRNKENLKKVQILIWILIALAIFGKETPIMTASIFGTYSGVFLVGIILVTLGGLLTFIPGAQIPGVIAIVVGFLISGGTIWAFFESLPSPFGIPIWAFLMIGIVFVLIFRKRISRRYTY